MFIVWRYKPIKPNVFYVSPANSLGFMDGGIDKPLSCVVFPEIEPIVKENVKYYGKLDNIDRKYLPIGSSIIVQPSTDDIYLDHVKDRNSYLVVAPTMLLPQRVDKTKNCYYATMATMYNVVVNCNKTDSEITNNTVRYAV